MSEQQITDRLVAAHAAYVERTGKQPYILPSIRLDGGGSSSASFCGTSINNLIIVTGKTCAATLDALDAAIAAIPDEATRLRNEHAKALARAIETGRAAGLPMDHMNPLTEAMKRLSENALTYEGAE